MKEQCFSKIELMSYFSGDIDKQKVDNVECHVRACPECKKYLDSLQQSKETFLLKYPVPGVTKKTIVVGFNLKRQLLALAASMVLIVTGTTVLMKTGSVTERIKGAQKIELFVLTSGNTIEKRDHHVYYAGEKIQFSYSVAGTTYFSLLSIDETGKVYVYFPISGTKPLRLDPGAGVPLPSSIELDNYIGKEMYFAVFSSKSFNVHSLSEKLHSTFVNAKSLDKTELRVAGCQIEQIIIDKQVKNK